MSSFLVSHQCPQCGGEIEFAETDHFLICPFCDVRNFMWTAQYFRYIFNPRIAGEEIVYAPYLHFKGNAYFVKGNAIDQKVLEFTSLGMNSQSLPTNLGWKTQTQKLSILDKPARGTFLRFDLRPADMLRAAVNVGTGQQTTNHAFIGEALSLVYFPLVVDGRALRDGLTGDVVAQIPEKFTFEKFALDDTPTSDFKFIPAICPECGWNLSGEGRSLGLPCDNCDTAWEPVGGQLVKRPVSTLHTVGGQFVYLPFWTFDVRFTQPSLETYGDVMRFTNQRPNPGTDLNARMRFWSPAFKIHAQSMVRLCTRPTMAQQRFELSENVPRKHRYPITLSSAEGAELIPITLASLTMRKQAILPGLNRVEYQADDCRLIYLPFRKTGLEVIQNEINLALNPAALAFGQYL